MMPIRSICLFFFVTLSTAAAIASEPSNFPKPPAPPSKEESAAAYAYQKQASEDRKQLHELLKKCGEMRAKSLKAVNQIIVAEFTGETRRFFMTTPQGNGGWNVDFIFKPVSVIQGETDNEIALTRALSNAKILSLEESAYINGQFVKGQQYLLLLERTDLGKDHMERGEGEKPYHKPYWYRDVQIMVLTR